MNDYVFEELTCLMYTNGQGVAQDFAEAHKWVNLAASRIYVSFQNKYAEIRDALAKQMTPAQVTEAQRLAREWQALSPPMRASRSKH